MGLTSKKVTLPYVPEEGQPPEWWQDLRVQAIVISVVTSIVRKLGMKVDDAAFSSHLAETVGWAFQIVIPAVLGAIGQVKSIWRRQIVSGTIQTAVEQPANVPPALTAEEAVAAAPDVATHSAIEGTAKSRAADELRDHPKP